MRVLSSSFLINKEKSLILPIHDFIESKIDSHSIITLDNCQEPPYQDKREQNQLCFASLIRRIKMPRTI